MAGPSGSVQGPCEAKWGYTTFSVSDWDDDDDLDIVYNSILGRIGLLRRENGGLVRQSIDNSQTLSGEPLPVAIDFNSDGIMDIVALDSEGFLALRLDRW